LSPYKGILNLGYTAQLDYEAVTLDEEVTKLISISEAIKLVYNGLYQAEIALHLQNTSGHSPKFDYRLMPCISNVLLSNIPDLPITDGTASNRLDSILLGWGMRRHNIIGDGNCFFSSAAFHLSKKLATVCSLQE
jgi:hypothetical protein